MSDRPSLAQGSMSKGGTINPVNTGEPELDPQDKTVLCSAICHCSATPNISQDGKNLKQACVSQRLGELDEILKGRSPFSTARRPATATAGYPAGSKYWDADPQHPPFKPGRGMIRRPDVVIVKHPGQPPTQDNIKQVVEMKFPPDKRDNTQVTEYGKIAGSDKKVVVLKSGDCDCSQQRQTSRVPTEQLGWAAAAASTLVYLLTRGRSPRPSLPAPAY